MNKNKIRDMMFEWETDEGRRKRNLNIPPKIKLEALEMLGRFMVKTLSKEEWAQWRKQRELETKWE